MIDSNGLVHAIWLDAYAGYVYSQWDGTQWSDPKAVNFPFNVDTRQPNPATAPLPTLVADNSGNVHAFWVGKRGALYYSKVLGSNFGNSAAWSQPKILSDSATKISAAADSQGGIHMAYIRSETSDKGVPGIYYRKSLNGGGNWSGNVPLYVSPYFRGLTNDNSNVSVSTTHTDQGEVIYVSWDNPGLKRIFFTRSDDRGVNWTLPNEVDNPSSTLGSDTPFDILLHPDGDQLLAVWKSGEPGGSCIQVYKTSSDRGITWSDRAEMLAEISGCPQSNQFIPGPDGNPILITSIQDQVYLLSWNGKEWSDAQPQAELNGFENPDTLGTIQFRCRKPAMSTENLLYVIGCEQGGGADTWVLSKPITSVENWFPTAVSWEGPTQVITQTVVAQSPVLISDPQGITHALWTQADASSPDAVPAAIYYSRNDSGTWTTPVSILTSPEGKADQISVAQDSKRTINGNLGRRSIR